MAKKTTTKSFDGLKENPRYYMEMAIDVMEKSVQEPRGDKTSPKVGAVLVMPDSEVVTAFRGELRHGDHAEFTLIERKKRSESLDGSILFATLEPCAPGSRNHPKLGCAERIVNARIKKVWIGVEDSDPTVDRKGIKYLEDNGVEVEMFDSDLQRKIYAINEQFFKEADERAKNYTITDNKILLTLKEAPVSSATIDDLSEEDVNWYLDLSSAKTTFKSETFFKLFVHLGFLAIVNDKTVPTGLGILLFGKNPSNFFPNARIMTTLIHANGDEEIYTVDGSLIRQPEKILDWFKTKISSKIDRSASSRLTSYEFPIEVFRETIINAIVHRDYDIEGAQIQVMISNDQIIVKSPGAPVSPITFEKFKSFNAPTLSRNPRAMFIFEQLKLVEQRGFGFKEIKNLPVKYHLSLPEITFEAPYLVLAFNRKAVDATVAKTVSLSGEEQIGLEWIRSQKSVSRKQYAEKFNFDEKKALRHLQKFKKLALVKDNGEKPSSNKFRYIVED